MCRRLLNLITVVLTVIIAGCASPQHDLAVELKPSDGAMLSNWQSGTFALFTYTEIEKIDGVDFSKWAQNGRGLVDPGLRNVSVAGTYVGVFGKMDTGRAELPATLTAGHSYQVKAEPGVSRMTLWIEDLETGAVVTERKTVVTKRWVKWFP